MADAIRSKVIRADVVSAYSHCPRKAFLLHCTEERGTPHEYQVILEEHTNVSRTSYLAALQQTSTSIRSYKDGTISSGIDVLTEANLKVADLDGYCDVLTKVRGTRRENPSTYEPTIVVGTQRIEKDQLFHLSFTGFVLGQIQGRPPARGYLVTAGGERHRANLQPMYKIVGSIVERIRSWSADSPAKPPAVILNKHCPYCVDGGENLVQFGGESGAQTGLRSGHLHSRDFYVPCGLCNLVAPGQLSNLRQGEAEGRTV